MLNDRSSGTEASGEAAAPSRRGFLGSALGGVSAVLGGLALSGCAHSARHEGSQSREGAQEGKTPDEACTSSLTGLQLRAVEEGEAVTMDYREDRLTLVLDERRRITRAYIG
ncbi:hypothetical protein ACFOW6_14570 [Fodinicurvata halophila]|uniref:Uncharacterized protein n=1 Tax=Fodinicurvata halophila TaxID=1419723 RepID=A0ABV8UPN7_9PROT